MPKAKGKKVTKKSVVIKRGQAQSQKQTINIHMEKPKTRRKPTRKKETIVKESPSYIQPSVTSGFTHFRGSINSTPSPTIIQNSNIDPELKLKLDNLERTLTNIQIEPQTAKIKQPAVPPVTGILAGKEKDIFTDALETPIKGKKLNFDKVEPSKKTLFGKLFSPFTSSNKSIFSKRKEQPRLETKEYPLLEFKDALESPSVGVGATAPSFNEPINIDVQTTPQQTGKQIREELELLVRQIHASHPNSKVKRNIIRSAVSKKLKELGVDSTHTDQYEKSMREYYDKIFKESNEIIDEPSSGKTKGRKKGLSLFPFT